MELPDLSFVYDLERHRFGRIEAFLTTGVEAKASAKEKSEALLEAFEKIESMLDEFLLQSKYVQKLPIGTQFARSLDAGYRYSIQDSLNPSLAELQYSFNVDNDYFDRPKLSLILYIPQNLGYWLVEYLLAELSPVPSAKAQDTLERMRSCMQDGQESLDPKGLLRENVSPQTETEYVYQMNASLNLVTAEPEHSNAELINSAVQAPEQLQQEFYVMLQRKGKRAVFLRFWWIFPLAAIVISCFVIVIDLVWPNMT